MQFQVPQFLDVEDKIVGPFTLKQFLYLIGSVGLAYMTWRYITFLGIQYLLALGWVALGGSLAFYRPNKKPLVYMIESAFNFIKSDRRFIWRRRKQEKMETHLDLGNFQSTTIGVGALPVSTSGQSKLNDLTWSMDVQESAVDAPQSHNDSLVI